MKDSEPPSTYRWIIEQLMSLDAEELEDYREMVEAWMRLIRARRNENG